MGLGKNGFSDKEEHMLYEKMRRTENLSWCKPYVNEDGSKAVIVNEGVAYPVRGITSVKEGDKFTDELANEIDAYDMHEVGCCDCPVKDDCECMVEE